MKISRDGQLTIPPALRKKHGLSLRCDVELVDQPDGILIVKSRKLARGKRVLAVLLGERKVKGRTADWLRLTRGAAA